MAARTPDAIVADSLCPADICKRVDGRLEELVVDDLETRAVERAAPDVGAVAVEEEGRVVAPAALALGDVWR